MSPQSEVPHRQAVPDLREVLCYPPHTVKSAGHFQTSAPISTLVEGLRRRAAEKPDAEHLILLDGDDSVRRLSFRELLTGADAVAKGLRGRGIEPRQTVALMLPTSFDFYFSFLGVLLAGAVPVPVYPPVKLDRLEEYAARQDGILRNAKVRALVTERRARALAGLLRPKVRGLDTLVLVPAGYMVLEDLKALSGRLFRSRSSLVASRA